MMRIASQIEQIECEADEADEQGDVSGTEALQWDTTHTYAYVTGLCGKLGQWVSLSPLWIDIPPQSPT